MPYFTLQMSPAGPIVNAFIGVSQARAAALKAQGQPIPAPIHAQALVDTGASGTCVDPSLFTTLGLQPTGAIAVNTPTTGIAPVMKDQYDVSIWVPAAANQAALAVHNIPVLSAELLQAQGLHALIGRDILANCLMTYDGQASLFTVAY